MKPFVRSSLVIGLAISPFIFSACKKDVLPSTADNSAATRLVAARASASESSAPAAAKLPRLLDLGADKCIPCKMMAPILEELKKEHEGHLIVDFIDVWKDPEAGKTYGVKSIPTQIFLDASGKELFRHVGFFAKDGILAKWKELGVELSAG